MHRQHRPRVTGPRGTAASALPRTIARLLPLLVVAMTATAAAPAAAQVRMKRPDRGAYEPPQLDPIEVNRLRSPGGSESRERLRPARPSIPTDASGGPLEEVIIDDEWARERGDFQARAPRVDRPPAKLRPVAHEEILLTQAPAAAGEAESDSSTPALPAPMPESPGSLEAAEAAEPELVPPAGGIPEPVPMEQPYAESSMTGGAYTDGRWIEGSAVACDACGGHNGLGCDDLACDARLCTDCQAGPWPRFANASLSFCPERWFGSAELLLMFRKGDLLPPLVTTGPSDDADTAGELGQAGTGVLAGGDPPFDDMTAGGRFMLGTWLDDRQCRSLTLRGWFAGEQSFNVSADGDTADVLARPFLNVTDGQTAEQDTQLVRFPDRANGSISISGDSNVYGADIAVRQFWYGDLGGTVDLLYGYQFMRFDEDLGIRSTSVSLDDDFAPVGAVLSIADTFETENEFHGGQLGIASRYREGCWSFDGLLKVGFGQLRRQARRAGTTRTSVDGDTSTVNEGLLVQSTNRGEITDHTFGWVPELDVSLGWHRFPRFDVTFGYHIIAMTDALQLSGSIDPRLAVNLADPPTGEQSPSAALRYDTFFVQGIHFGLKYVY